MGTLNYGRRRIDYNIRRSERTTIEISVYPDCRVEVVAPQDATDAVINSKVKKRLKWISRQQRGFESFFPKASPRQYVSGESWLYQGRQYRLKVISTDGDSKVALRRPVLAVETPDRDDKNAIKIALESWYRIRAKERFSVRYEECSNITKAFGIDTPEMRVQKMEKRWGSFSPSGRILLNPELVKAPTYCIDYVILHELCHAKYRKHDANFYKLLNRIVPDWLRLKSKLEHLPI